MFGPVHYKEFPHHAGYSTLNADFDGKYNLGHTYCYHMAPVSLSSVILGCLFFSLSQILNAFQVFIMCFLNSNSFLGLQAEIISQRSV